MIGSILLRTSPNPYISITIYNNDKLAYNYSHIWTFNKDVRYGFVINILLFSFLLLSFLLLSFLLLSFLLLSFLLLSFLLLSFLLLSFLLLSFLLLSFLLLSFLLFSVLLFSFLLFSVLLFSVLLLVFSCYSFLLVLINYFDKITGFSKITILS